MNIEFKLNIGFPRLDYNKWICRFKGHIMEDYEPEAYWSEPLWVAYLNKPEISKKCKRCGYETYKRKKKDKKPKTVKFSRYNKLKK